MKEQIDPDTGFTPSQQKKRFYELFGVEKSTTKTKRTKRSVAKGSSVVNKKEKCIELFNLGHSVSDVAKEVGISYANANYYKKFAE